MIMVAVGTERAQTWDALMNVEKDSDRLDNVARTARSDGVRDGGESTEGSLDDDAQAARVNEPVAPPQRVQGGKATIRSATSRS